MQLKDMRNLNINSQVMIYLTGTLQRDFNLCEEVGVLRKP